MGEIDATRDPDPQKWVLDLLGTCHGVLVRNPQTEALGNQLADMLDCFTGWTAPSRQLRIAYADVERRLAMETESLAREWVESAFRQTDLRSVPGDASAGTLRLCAEQLRERSRDVLGNRRSTMTTGDPDEIVGYDDDLHNTPVRRRDLPTRAGPPETVGAEAALRKLIATWLGRADRDQVAGGLSEAARCNTLRECAKDLSAALGWPEDVRRA